MTAPTNYSTTSSSSPDEEVYPLARMDASDVIDQIDAMRRQEESETYRCQDYLTANPSMATERGGGVSGGGGGSNNYKPVDENCRTKMCAWCCQVVDYCKLSRETVFVSVGYLDRFLSSSDAAAQNTLRDRREYQLFAMTALYLAIKVHETVEVDVSVMSKLSRGDYEQQDFVRAEGQLLRALGWRLSGPTATEFARRFLSLLPPSPPSPCRPTCTSDGESSSSDERMLADFARFQTELSVTDFTFFVTTRPSVIAAASILNAVETIENLCLSPSDRTAYVRTVKKVGGIIDPRSEREVDRARERLRRRFAESTAGYAMRCNSSSSGAAPSSSSPPTDASNDGVADGHGDEKKLCTQSSPVCVVKSASMM